MISASGAHVVSAVVFDMDGVLVDSELQWKLAERNFLLRRVPDWRKEDYRDITGLSPADLYGYLSRVYGLKESKQSFLDDCRKLAETIYKTKVSLADGLLETFRRVKDNRVPMAVASSSPRDWIQMVMERFNLGGWFVAVISADDVGGRAKPLPDIYLTVCRRLGFQPGSCAAVEDSSVGVKAAKSAGLYCLAFRNGANGDQDLSAADVEITGIRDVLPALGIS